MKRTSKCEVENGIGQIGNSILDGRESCLSSNTSSTIGLDRRIHHEKAARPYIDFRESTRTFRDNTITACQKTEIILGGRRQGARTGTFDAETEVTQGSHVEEE